MQKKNEKHKIMACRKTFLKKANLCAKRGCSKNFAQKSAKHAKRGAPFLSEKHRKSGLVNCQKRAKNALKNASESIFSVFFLLNRIKKQTEKPFIPQPPSFLAFSSVARLGRIYKH